MGKIELKAFIRNREGTFARSQKENDEYLNACNQLYEIEKQERMYEKKQEIQRQKLSDLYFKHLDATWEQIEYMRQAKSNRMKMYVGKWKFKNYENNT